ncbi:hypothetical protein [uncultured Methanobacterium sp.]|uniref:hypothetical protein n=1 Tax=uncultured Methanobacterium sp. TaxID=176306 RepID=UPI002AA90CCC|nr:hypothetical protein [uncultured Methanobacterium sp.]
MTRSRRYLNNLPNAERIKELARDILDNELELDQALQDNARIKAEIITLESQILSSDAWEDPQKIKNTKRKLDQLGSVLKRNDKEIAHLKEEISSSKSLVNEEIREGLSKLFQQAKSDRDEAQQDIIKHQQLVEEAHNRLMDNPTEESENLRDEWIRNLVKVSTVEEKLKNSEKELEAIKRVYRLEFG